jgi:hypothetical protein
MVQPGRANKITAANAGGLHPSAVRTSWTARIAEFRRWAGMRIRPS